MQGGAGGSDRECCERVGMTGRQAADVGSQVLKIFLYLSHKLGFHLKGDRGVIEGF